MNPRNLLRKLSACKAAQYWASQYNTLEDAWSACPRGDWLLWLWGHYCGDSMDDRRRPLVLAAAECARLALPYFEQHHPGDLRPHNALDIAEKWGHGEPVTRQEITDASAAAFDAAIDDAAAAPSYAAIYASYAPRSTFAAATATASLARCANIVRRHMPTPSFVQETP